jgi:hypothetical protein
MVVGTECIVVVVLPVQETWCVELMSSPVVGWMMSNIAPNAVRARGVPNHRFRAVATTTGGPMPEPPPPTTSVFVLVLSLSIAQAQEGIRWLSAASGSTALARAAW